MKLKLGKPILLESALLVKLERDLTRATSHPWKLRRIFEERTYRWSLKAAIVHGRLAK